ncbi:MAG: hypothetical protein HY560_11810 [Gemmatimonadetes bacterium]|nr:hypothetical protein [Gemmatimonadota bacterium]
MIAPVLIALTLLASPTTLVRPAAAGTLILKNSRFEAVQVELRMGPSTDCAANPKVGTRTLKRDQTWTVVSSDVVCWRRELVPGDVAQGWTAWNRVQPTTGTKQEVEL